MMLLNSSSGSRTVVCNGRSWPYSWSADSSIQCRAWPTRNALLFCAQDWQTRPLSMHFNAEVDASLLPIRCCPAVWVSIRVTSCQQGLQPVTASADQLPAEPWVVKQLTPALPLVFRHSHSCYRTNAATYMEPRTQANPLCCGSKPASESKPASDNARSCAHQPTTVGRTLHPAALWHCWPPCTLLAAAGGRAAPADGGTPEINSRSPGWLCPVWSLR